jgi:hypothetical protein
MFEGLLSVKSSVHNEEVKAEAISGDYSNQIHPDGDVIMHEDHLEDRQDENSWNHGAATGTIPQAFIETPAFNSKIFDIPSSGMKDQNALC